MLEHLKQQVIEQLRQRPECRNSDVALTISIWQTYFPQMISRNLRDEDCIKLKDLYELPREDNIKRIRAKLQEEALERIMSGKVQGDEHIYLPTDTAIAERRQINSAIWEKALGYFRSPVPTQTTQLPRPVGLIGFTQVGENHFIADGAEGKRYHVRFEGGGWKCECDASRFDPDHYCKHIKEIVLYLGDVKREKAAKDQTNLF